MSRTVTVNLTEEHKRTIASILGYDPQHVTGQFPKIEIDAFIQYGFKRAGLEVNARIDVILATEQHGKREITWTMNDGIHGYDESWTQTQSFRISSHPLARVERSLFANDAHRWTEKSSWILMEQGKSKIQVRAEIGKEKMYVGDDYYQANYSMPKIFEAENFSSLYTSPWSIQVADIAEIIIDVAGRRYKDLRPGYTTASLKKPEFA